MYPMVLLQTRLDLSNQAPQPALTALPLLRPEPHGLCVWHRRPGLLISRLRPSVGMYCGAAFTTLTVDFEGADLLFASLAVPDGSWRVPHY